MVLIRKFNGDVVHIKGDVVLGADMFGEAICLGDKLYKETIYEVGRHNGCIYIGYEDGDYDDLGAYELDFSSYILINHNVDELRNKIEIGGQFGDYNALLDNYRKLGKLYRVAKDKYVITKDPKDKEEVDRLSDEHSKVGDKIKDINDQINKYIHDNYFRNNK